MKILALMLTIIIVPVVYLTFFVTYNSESYYEKFIPSNTNANVEKDLETVESFFIDKEAALVTQSHLMALDDSSEYIYNLLDHFLEMNPSFLNSYYTKEIGEDFANNHGDTPVDGRTRDWYKDAVAQEGFTISAPYVDVLSHKYVITLSIPVYDEGSLLGVFGVDFLVENMVEKAEHLTSLRDVSYVLRDWNGTILYYDKDKYQDLSVLMDRLENKDQEEVKVSEFSLENIKMDLTIIFYSDDYQINKTRIGFEMALLFLFVIMVTILLATRITNKLSVPLNRFKKKIQTMEEGHVDDGLTLDDEFRVLFDNFNALSEKIRLDKLKLSRRINDLQKANNDLMEKNIALESIYKNLKQLEKKVKKSKNDYESILDNVQGMIWVLDDKGQIVFVNSDLCESIDYQSDDLVDQGINKIIHNTYDHHFTILDILKERDYNRIELSLISAHDERILVEANTSRIRDEKGNLLYIYGICRSIRETKKLFHDYNVKIQEQNLMMELTETASMNVSMVQVIKVIFEKINSIFGWSVGTIRFLNENNEFQLVARTDVGSDYIMSSSIPNEDTCLSYVVKEDKILYAKSTEDLPVNEPIYNQMIQSGYVIIFIPVGNNEIGRGVISLVIDEVSMLEKEEILKSFTNTILIVVERALVYEKLKNDYIRMIKVLAEAGDDKDTSSVGHSNRVAQYAKKIGEHMYLDDNEIVDLEICGLLHDIGKIGISDEYLRGKDENSLNQVKEHPIIGKHMLKDIGLAQCILDGIEMHHLNFDLSGYPEVDYIDSLPLFPRIIQVADEFDNFKVKGEDMSNIQVYDKMKKDIGTIYCPQVMRVLKNMIMNDRL